jgi:hypothetical protein
MSADPYGFDLTAWRAEQRAAFAVSSPQAIVRNVLDEVPRFDFDELVNRMLGDLRRDAEERHAVTVYGVPVVYSDLVPPDTLVLTGGGPRPDVVRGSDGRIAGVIRLSDDRVYWVAPWDRYGYPSRVRRALEPLPFETLHTPGAREAARARRQRKSRRHR